MTLKNGAGTAVASFQAGGMASQAGSFYEEFVPTATACTGALTNSVSYVATKVGRSITLTIPAITGTTTNVANINLGVPLPASFRPLTELYTMSSYVRIGGVAQAAGGMIRISTDGSILLYRDGSATTWGTAANTGIPYQVTLSWTV